MALAITKTSTDYRLDASGAEAATLDRAVALLGMPRLTAMLAEYLAGMHGLLDAEEKNQYWAKMGALSPEDQAAILADIDEKQPKDKP